MKKRIAAAVCALLAVLAAGCGGDAAAYHQVSSALAESSSSSGSPAESPGAERPRSDKPLEGHLTVKSFWDEEMDVYVRDFAALHPGVTIDLIRAGEDGVQSFDDYHAQTAVELMSGSGADIVDVAGFAVFQYAKSGAFCDLYPLMDSDPDFHREDYYTNIFQGKEFEGSLYSMPCGFTYDMLFASRPLLEASKLRLPDSLNYQEMLALYKKVLAGVDHTPRLLPGLTPYTFFWYEFPEYYDTTTRTARFVSTDFLKYLHLTKENIPILNDNDFTRVVYDNDSFLCRDYLFCRFDISWGGDLLNLVADLPNTAGPVPMLSTSGKAYFRTMREYAIASSSPNKELAWEFLKYLVEEKEVPEDTGSEYAQKYDSVYNNFIPINKANFFGSFRFTLEYWFEQIGEDPALRWREGDKEQLIRQALELVHGWNQQRNAEQAEGEIYGLLCEDLNRYYYLDLLSPEETAGKLQNRMTIFLQE